MPLGRAKNKYIKRARISERKFRAILKEFCRDSTATETADRVSVSRKTVNRYYRLFRERIAKLCEESSPLDGEVEVDESYFGAKRVRGKRGRGAGEKIPVVGLLKRGGNVYTQVVEDCSRAELRPVIRGKVVEDSTIYTDGWRSYDGLVVDGYKHYRIRHSDDTFARGANHINGIESFWSFAKRRLRRFNGVPKDTFLLHLKESEYRWNHRGTMYTTLLKNFREDPL